MVYFNIYITIATGNMASCDGGGLKILLVKNILSPFKIIIYICVLKMSPKY